MNGTSFGDLWPAYFKVRIDEHRYNTFFDEAYYPT